MTTDIKELLVAGALEAAEIVSARTSERQDKLLNYIDSVHARTDQLKTAIDGLLDIATNLNERFDTMPVAVQHILSEKLAQIGDQIQEAVRKARKKDNQLASVLFERKLVDEIEKARALMAEQYESVFEALRADTEQGINDAIGDVNLELNLRFTEWAREQKQEVDARIGEIPQMVEGARGEPGEAGPPGTVGRAKLWERDRTYARGASVAHNGGLWQSKITTEEEPGLSVDWTLLTNGVQDVFICDGDLVLRFSDHAERNCGPVVGEPGRSPVPRSTYDPRETYRALDIVAVKGGGYIARRDNPGKCPGPDWQMISQRGTRGAPGKEGAQGKQGEPGPPGPIGPPGVSVRWRGRWALGERYRINDLVNHNQSIWIALTDTEVPPKADGENWDLVLHGAGSGGGSAAGGGAPGSTLHAQLIDTDSDGHPGSVIEIPGGTQGNAVTIAADGTLQDGGIPPGGSGSSDHGALTGLADDDHTQYHNDLRGDARYYTQGQVDTALSGKADTGHTHTASQVTDFDTEVSNNASVAANTAKVSADGSIDTHSDVDTTTATPSNNDVLQWNGSNWVPGTVSGGSSNNWLTANNGSDFTVAPSAAYSGAVALGENASANNSNVIVIGTDAIAGASNDEGSIAIGRGAKSQGDLSVSLGDGATTAFTNGATALGSGAVANTTNTLAVGRLANAGGIYAIAIGHEAAADLNYAIAIGRQAHAPDMYSIAIGEQANANSTDSKILIETDNAAFRVSSTGTVESSSDGGTTWNTLFQDNETITDWGLTAATIGGASPSWTWDLDGGHIAELTLTADATITMSSTAGHTNLDAKLYLTTGGFTPTFAWTGCTVYSPAGGFDWSTSGVYEVNITKVGTNVFITEQRMVAV